MSDDVKQQIAELRTRVAALEAAARVPRWASANDAAKYLRVHPETIRKWTAEGLLTAYGGTRYQRWNLDELDEFLRSSPSPGSGRRQP